MQPLIKGLGKVRSDATCHWPGIKFSKKVWCIGKVQYYVEYFQMILNRERRDKDSYGYISNVTDNSGKNVV